MILSDFLSRQKQDEIIPISFNMQNILQSKYYNIDKSKDGKYLVQTRSQGKSSSIPLPEVHKVDKGIDPNIRLEKQVIKPIISDANDIPQIKSRLGQGRTGIKQKIKLPVSPPLDKPIIQIAEKLILHNLKISFSQKQHQKFQFQKVLNFMINSFQYPII